MKVFTLEDGIELAPVGWHCALTGSVLREGQSNKDIDIVVYPHKKKSSHCPNKRTLHGALRRAGLSVWMTHAKLRANWKKCGISDGKWVEIWVSDKGRVDVMVLS